MNEKDLENIFLSFFRKQIRDLRYHRDLLQKEVLK